MSFLTSPLHRLDVRRRRRHRAAVPTCFAQGAPIKLRLGPRQLRQPRRLRQADGAGDDAGGRGDQRRRRPARHERSRSSSTTPSPTSRSTPSTRSSSRATTRSTSSTAASRRRRARRSGRPSGAPTSSISTTCCTRAACATATASSPERRRRRRSSRSSRSRRSSGAEGLRAGGRLQLRPDHREVGRALRQAARRLGAADRLLPARRRRLRLDDRQDPGGQARLGVRGAGRRRAPFVLPPVGGVGDEQEDPALLDDLRRRQRAPRALACRGRRHP